MKTCRQLADDLIALADGECLAERRDEIEAHVEQCAECRGELARLRQSLALASTIWEERADAAEVGEVSLLAGSVSQTLQASDASTINSTKRQRSRGNRQPQITAWVAIAVAAALLVAGTVWWWNNASTDELANSTDNGTQHNTTEAGNRPTDDGEDGANNRTEIEAEIAQLTNEIEDVAQTARLTAAAEFLRARPELEAEYQSAMEYITRRGSD